MIREMYGDTRPERCLSTGSTSLHEDHEGAQHRPVCSEAWEEIEGWADAGMGQRVDEDRLLEWGHRLERRVDQLLEQYALLDSYQIGRYRVVESQSCPITARKTTWSRAHQLVSRKDTTGIHGATVERNLNPKYP